MISLGSHAWKTGMEMKTERVRRMSICALSGAGRLGSTSAESIAPVVDHIKR